MEKQKKVSIVKILVLKLRRAPKNFLAPTALSPRASLGGPDNIIYNIIVILIMIFVIGTFTTS